MKGNDHPLNEFASSFLSLNSTIATMITYSIPITSITSISTTNGYTANTKPSTSTSPSQNSLAQTLQQHHSLLNTNQSVYDVWQEITISLSLRSHLDVFTFQISLAHTLQNLLCPRSPLFSSHFQMSPIHIAHSTTLWSSSIPFIVHPIDLNHLHKSSLLS